MQKKLCCPQCGNGDLQVTTETNTQTSGKNYSAGQGCLGYLLAGPLGLLCGLCGTGKTTTTTNKTYWMCPKCGKKFRNPDDIREEIKKSPTISLGTVLIISTVLTAIMMFFLLSFSESSFVWFLGVIMFLAGTFGGFMSKKSMDLKRAELERELKEIEENMSEHTDSDDDE